MPLTAAEKQAEKRNDAFIPYPAFLMTGWSWQQRLWQQQMLEQAWAQAWAVVYGPRLIRVRAADLPRVLRN